MATKITLGDVLIDPAPRKRLKFNNPRSIARQDIPGGPPVYQDMGEEETTLAWEGVLDGEDAYRKAIQIESMKDAGLVVQLIVSDFPELSKLVRIRSFPWDLVRADRVEYTIELVAEMPPPVVSQVIAPAAPQTGAEEPSPPTAPTGKTYVIKQGDTLWALAQKNYGSGTRWREIANANGITDPTKLQIGQQIIIPG